jgi:tRNA A37 threonylcarbamoyladenosine dehydratase
VENAPNSVFKFHDTLTSRAEIGDLAAKFSHDVIAIIGMGGTGSYILDLLVRTPVKEIRIFDNDLFYVHNAFRSPGQTRENEFNKPKVEIHKARYDDYRHGVKAQQKFIDTTSAGDFDGVTFAFACVDKGSSRSGVFDLLIGKGIPFIDVGMGLDRNKVDNSLTGMLRTTYLSVPKTWSGNV